MALGTGNNMLRRGYTFGVKIILLSLNTNDNCFLLRGINRREDITYTALRILLLLCHLFGIFRFICL